MQIRGKSDYEKAIALLEALMRLEPDKLLHPTSFRILDKLGDALEKYEKKHFRITPTVVESGVITDRYKF